MEQTMESMVKFSYHQYPYLFLMKQKIKKYKYLVSTDHCHKSIFQTHKPNSPLLNLLLWILLVNIDGGDM